MAVTFLAAYHCPNDVLVVYGTTDLLVDLHERPHLLQALGDAREVLPYFEAAQLDPDTGKPKPGQEPHERAFADQRAYLVSRLVEAEARLLAG